MHLCHIIFFINYNDIKMAQYKHFSSVQDLTLPYNKFLEIDFQFVDSGEKSGDAIAFRYGDLSNSGSQRIILIDGGTMDSGQQLVDLVRSTYGTDKVDLVISTHPDSDHTSGLRLVIDKLKVGELWMHRPWDHSEYIRHLFHDGRITDDSLEERIRNEYDFAHQLEAIALKKGINIREPFAGRQFDNGVITVLGPSVDYYRSLIPQFTRTPEAKTAVGKAISGIKEAINWIRESLDIETLDESGETSAENSSSAVVLFSFYENKHLFTGDAGIPALRNVIEYSKANGINLSDLQFFQVPHHGSRRNVSPFILDEIRAKTAFVSASIESPKHPSKKVTNALYRRHTEVYSTQGASICHRKNSPLRNGWYEANKHPFYELVEE
jgi:beta-lactamase superfamily II metal-dependent hydrolase